LRKNDTGGLFVTEDPATDQGRVDAGLVLPTGPLPGGRELEPPAGTPARALEDQAIVDVGATRENFLDAGRELPGARRPVLLRLDPSSHATEETTSAATGRSLRLSFSLPPGGYATVVVDALLGGERPAAQ
jgi:tRNA pseudouridine13 synthase